MSRALVTFLRAAGALVVLIGSFFATLKLLDRQDVKDPSSNIIVAHVKPSDWRLFGRATYDIKGDAVLMRGPGYIYKEEECGTSRCSAEFSIYVDQTGPANIELMYVRYSGTSVGEGTIREITGRAGTQQTVQAQSPAGAQRVRAVVYAPSAEPGVIFREPVLIVKPVS